MNDILKLLLSSPWFWIVLVLMILILAFRPQLARLIDRTQRARAEASKEGAKIEIEAASPSAAEKPSDASLPASATPASPVRGKVDMQDVLLDHASEIDEIKGQVKMKDVILDEKSKIGKINGG
jgi:hypothetical protein